MLEGSRGMLEGSRIEGERGGGPHSPLAPHLALRNWTTNFDPACHDGGIGETDVEREPTWWEQYGYKVKVFGFLVLMFGVLPLLISGR